MGNVFYVVVIERKAGDEAIKGLSFLALPRRPLA